MSSRTALVELPISRSETSDSVYMMSPREEMSEGDLQSTGEGRRREQGLGRRSGGWFDTGTL